MHSNIGGLGSRQQICSRLWQKSPFPGVRLQAHSLAVRKVHDRPFAIPPLLFVCDPKKSTLSMSRELALSTMPVAMGYMQTRSKMEERTRTAYHRTA